MSRIKPLTRNQLAAFLPTPEAIKAFEKVMSQALELLPEDVSSINSRIDQLDIEQGNALSIAYFVLAALSKAEHYLSVIASIPPTIPDVDQLPVNPVYCLGSLASQNTERLQLTGTIEVPKTITAAGTVGAQTINKISGSVNFAAGATSLVVTNSTVTASSIVLCTVSKNDTTMKTVAAVPSAGSFTIYANAAPTAETKVSFLITN